MEEVWASHHSSFNVHVYSPKREAMLISNRVENFGIFIQCLYYSEMKKNELLFTTK